MSETTAVVIIIGLLFLVAVWLLADLIDEHQRSKKRNRK